VLGHALAGLALGGLLSLVAASAAPAASGSIATAPGYHGGRSFVRGFADSVWIWSGQPSLAPAKWDADAYAEGAGIVEVEVDWTTYEPTAPVAGANPTSSASTDYSNWAELDQTVETLAANNLHVMFLITAAPRWAYGESPAGTVNTEGYDINTTALGNFVQALANRYDGSFPAPATPGARLPRVTYYQDWAEANNNARFGPQWQGAPGRRVNVGADLYRKSLNAFYAGVKAGDRSDKVVFTGVEPWGDPSGGAWVAPTTFLANVLCLNAKLAKEPCSDPAHFDILAADPYEAGNVPPTSPALSPTDVQIPDLWKLERIMNAAVSAHTVLPDSHKPMWVTEFGYNTKAPSPYGVQAEKEARWQEDAFYVAWKQGVDVFLWYLIRDWSGHNYIDDWFSGTYTYNAAPKASWTSYRFPFVVAKDSSRAQIWGIAPTNGTLSVQQAVGGTWRTIKVFHARFGAIFTALLPLPAAKTGVYRAVQGTQTSLPWTAQL